MQKQKLLLVEDDELTSELIYKYLSECNFNVTPVFTATDCVSYIKNEHYDILILDLNLPDFTGYEVLKSIKQISSIPVIVTSAYSDTKSKLMAFKYGANDYMVKPIDIEELEARIWLQLGKNSEIQIQEKKKNFEIKNSNIYFKQMLLSLTTIEFEILKILIKNANQIIKREDLISTLSSISSPRSLDNHIKNIRKKIDDNGNKAIYIKTVYGVGYTLHN